jgi:hypothetical protein
MNATAAVPGGSVQDPVNQPGTPRDGMRPAMCQDGIRHDDIPHRDSADGMQAPWGAQTLAGMIRRSLAEFGEQRMTPELERRIVDRAVALYLIRRELV